MKAVCLLSGGMDSSTLAYVAKSRGYEILALHVNYGQRTERKELISAKKIASLLKAEAFVEINLDYFAKFGGSSLTDEKIAVEEYDPVRSHVPNTYVRFGNANLLSIATSFAEARGRCNLHWCPVTRLQRISGTVVRSSLRHSSM